MTQAPEWLTEGAHLVRRAQIERDHRNLARERRRGGRAMASWAEPTGARGPSVPSRKGVPAMVSCGICGQTFATKGEKRQHKLSCGDVFDTGQGAPVDDAGQFGRPQDHITPEIKARADAEWAAMDWRGHLPKGWVWPADGRSEG